MRHYPPRLSAGRPAPVERRVLGHTIVDRPLTGVLGDFAVDDGRAVFVVEDPESVGGLSLLITNRHD